MVEIAGHTYSHHARQVIHVCMPVDVVLHCLLQTLWPKVGGCHIGAYTHLVGGKGQLGPGESLL